MHFWDSQMYVYVFNIFFSFMVFPEVYMQKHTIKLLYTECRDILWKIWRYNMYYIYRTNEYMLYFIKPAWLLVCLLFVYSYVLLK